MMDTQRDGRRDGPRVRRVEPFRGIQRQMKVSVSEDGWKNTQTERKTDRHRQTDRHSKKDRQKGVERDAATDRQTDNKITTGGRESRNTYQKSCIGRKIHVCLKKTLRQGKTEKWVAVKQPLKIISAESIALMQVDNRDQFLPKKNSPLFFP